MSLGIGKAPLSGLVKSSSESAEFTAVGEEGVVEGEVKTIWRREGEEWVERGAKVEVGAWRHVLSVQDSYLVQLG